MTIIPSHFPNFNQLFSAPMKKFVLLSVIIFTCLSLHAQDKKQRGRHVSIDSMPFMRNPELPAFNIWLMDSFNYFNTYNIPKGRPSLLILFDPECKHCQSLTKELMAGMDSISNIDMYWFTLNKSMTVIRNFCADNHFADHPNIKAVGRDYEMFSLDFFEVNSLPDLALYDENKKIVHLFEGRATIRELYDYTHKK